MLAVAAGEAGAGCEGEGGSRAREGGADVRRDDRLTFVLVCE